MGRLISILLLFSNVSAEISTCTTSHVAGHEDENSLLQDRNIFWSLRTAADEKEVDYVVTKKYVETDAPGLAYRMSADLDDRDPEDSLSLWGSIVRGVPVGMNWLKVGSKYLPMRVGGHPVVEREIILSAATLAMTGQEPEVTEPEEAEPEAAEPEAAEPEAAEPEAAEPEAAESEAAEPEAAEPESEEASEAEVAEEEIEEEIEEAATALEGEEDPAEQDAVEDATEPEAPEVPEEEPVAPEEEPEATEEEPQATEEETEQAEEVAVEQQATEEVATEPEATEPEATETEVEVTEPEATETAAIEPEATAADEVPAELVEPEFVEPEPEPFDGVVVEFGVIFRSLPMLDFQSGTFTASLAFTQRWPLDADSYDDAAVGDGDTPWSPKLVVTNHDIGGVEAISTSRTVNQTTNMVTQVDYLTVRVLQTFELNSFPFDSQVLSVRVAPASPGGVSMKLVPIDVLGEPTLDPQLLEGHGFRLQAVNEEETILQSEDDTLADPARGVVEVAMGRRSSAYFSQLFLPSLLVLCVCWSTFFLPVPDTAFTTPRTAVTAVVFVAMLVLFLHVEQMVPARFGRMWIDVFTENVAILVFAAVAFNTLEQHVHTNMKRPSFSSRISRELQVFYPLLSAGLLGICFFVTRGKTLSLLSAFSRFYLLAGILGYSAAAYARALASEEGKPRGSMVRSPR